MKTSYLLLIVTLLFSCSKNYIDDKLESSPEKEFAIAYIDSLSDGSLDYCYDVLLPEFQNAEAKLLIRNAHEFLKFKEEDTSRVTSYSVTTMNDISYTNLEFEYQYENDWVYFSLHLLNDGGNIKLQGFNLNAVKASQVEENKFTLKNATIKHYIALLLTICVPLFILVSIVFIAITPMKLKFLWIIFALFGIFAIHFNWSTGDFMLFIKQLSPDGTKEMVKMAFLKISILGAGYSRQSVLHPWIFHFSIPVGAIIFWFKRRKIMEKKKLQEVENYGS